MRAADQRRDPLQGLGVRDRCAAELEDRQLTHRPTSGEPASASGKRRAALYGDAIDCGEAVRRTTIAASYTPAGRRRCQAERSSAGRAVSRCTGVYENVQYVHDSCDSSTYYPIG